MKRWLEDHAPALQGCAAAITALAAVAALVGVKVQIDANAEQQREQSAREIYREFLNLSISKPEFADPDYCALKDRGSAVAYEDYVEYLLYTAEQTLSASPDWEPTMIASLARHREYLCGQKDWRDAAPEVRGLIRRFQTQSCAVLAEPRCAAAEEG